VAVVGVGQPVEAAEQRGLARAALADERHALPRRTSSEIRSSATTGP
jgi:hypothetical protein